MPVNSSQRICCRSSPRDRRKRRTIPRIEAGTPGSTSNVPIAIRAPNADLLPRPIGFDMAMCGSEELNGPGRSANPTVAKAAPATISQNTGRQRGDGKRPSGKSRKTSGIWTTPGTRLQAPTQATSPVAGNRATWTECAT